ncbi:MAG: hypothetical protein CMM08_06365 [Rhodospirillaceae bacterium]|nr:hypothetical protein [Rhodospirillaceae bacterium]
MLRASGEKAGGIELEAVLGDGDGGVAHGRLLTRFAEAVLGADNHALWAVRRELQSTLGDAALVDSAAVVATFSSLDRMANATGIPLEASTAEATADFRAQLGLDAFAK